MTVALELKKEIPVGRCQCGCGQPTRMAKRTRRRLGHQKDRPLRFLNGHGARLQTDAAEACKKAEAVEPDFGNWLAGFVDGEGCFIISQNGQGARFCAFSLSLREDDFPILVEIQQRTGLGNARMQHPRSHRDPFAKWGVSSKVDCLALVGIFERHPLRAKKRRDFEIWAEAVRFWSDRMSGNWDVIDRLRINLSAVKRRPGS